MLIAFGGLPGSGKSTIAALLAHDLAAVHLRIDTVEQSLLRAGVEIAGPEGYLVARELAADQLKIGLTVVVDAVNPIATTRAYWRDLADEADAPLWAFEIVCSDPDEHRLRVESRIADIDGHRLPNWQEVVERQYEPWAGAITIDTAGQTPRESAANIKARLGAPTAT